MQINLQKNAGKNAFLGARTKIRDSCIRFYFGTKFVYHCSGRKVECYSNESPYVFWNGCWLIKQGTYWYAVDGDGDKITGVYGDQVTLLNDGRWKCVRGNYVSYRD